MASFHTRRRVEFADTDMAGIVHFARFFVFMETAEHQLLESFGTPIHFHHEGREIGWPRVAAQAEYRSPARVGEVLDIEVAIARRGRRAMTYRFVFRSGDRLVAEGEISSICCALGGERLEPVPIPDFLAARFDALAAAETPVEAAVAATAALPE